jgi:hypothetical protein
VQLRHAEDRDDITELRATPVGSGSPAMVRRAPSLSFRPSKKLCSSDLRISHHF